MSESERILLEWLCLDHGGEEAEKIVEIAERARAEGYRQGLERAAEIAEARHGCSPGCGRPEEIADAIRAELGGKP